MHFFQKKINIEEVGGGHLALLQQSMADKIMCELDQLLDVPVCNDILDASSADVIRDRIAGLAFHLVLQGETALDRRVFSKLRKPGAYLVRVPEYYEKLRS